MYNSSKITLIREVAGTARLHDDDDHHLNKGIVEQGKVLQLGLLNFIHFSWAHYSSLLSSLRMVSLPSVV